MPQPGGGGTAVAPPVAPLVGAAMKTSEPGAPTPSEVAEGLPI